MIGVRPVQVRQDSITRWMQRRAMAVRSLRLRGSGDLEGALVPVTERPQPAEVLEHPRIHDFNRRAASAGYPAFILGKHGFNPRDLPVKMMSVGVALHGASSRWWYMHSCRS